MMLLRYSIILSAILVCGFGAKEMQAQPATAASPPDRLAPGVTIRAFAVDGRLPQRPTIAEGQTPNYYAVHEQIDLRDRLVTSHGELRDEFAGEVTAWLKIDETGRYRFRLVCDDGAALFLNERLICDTETFRGFTAGADTELEAGWYALRLPFYEDHGQFYLQLYWQRPGADGEELIPTEQLFTEPGQTFVTAPGTKRFFFAEDPREPGDGRPLVAVHPSMTLEEFRGPEFRPPVGAMCFLPDHRLAVATWDGVGAVYLIDGLMPGDERGVTIQRFAAGLGEPLGMVFHEGHLLVAQKQEITRLVDVDGDDVADRYEVVAGGWPASHNYHEFTFNLVAKDGFLFTATSVPLKSGVTNYTPGSDPAYAVGRGPGSILRIDPRTGSWDIFAEGLRTPNGMNFGTNGEIFVADNQGSWLPSSRINLVREGGFYGHQLTPDGRHATDPPVVWMPQDEIGNSPSEPVVIPDGPYRSQMLVGDVTHGGIKRIMVERINDQYQGAVFRFSQGVEAGVNRLIWGPDGKLYVGGVGSNGNWHHQQKKFGLQRLAWNAEDDGRITMPFEMHSIHARANGFNITFTKPVDRAVLEDASRYAVQSWRYVETVDYGGPKIEPRVHTVSRAIPSRDGRQVFLELPGLRAGTVVHLRLIDMMSRNDERPWTTEAWYTLNALGSESGPAFSDRGFSPIGPLPRTAPKGAVVLFDGRDAGNLIMARDHAMPFGWQILPDGSMAVDIDAGDVLSRERFGSGWLHVEWLSPPGGPLATQQNGNSGVKLQERYEIQIMNTPGSPHPARFNEAGSIYRQKPADVNASLGAGVWQVYDIHFTAPQWEGTRKVRNARLSMYWNGELVHDDVEVPEKTGVSKNEAPGLHPILFQAHASQAIGPVRFRNIWFLPQDAEEE